MSTTDYFVVLLFCLALLMVLRGPSRGVRARQPAPPQEHDPDPMPGPVDSPSPGESGNDYAKRCDLVLCGNVYYSRAYLEWVKRQTRRTEYRDTWSGPVPHFEMRSPAPPPPGRKGAK